MTLAQIPHATFPTPGLSESDGTPLAWPPTGRQIADKPAGGFSSAHRFLTLAWVAATARGTALHGNAHMDAPGAARAALSGHQPRGPLRRGGIASDPHVPRWPRAGACTPEDGGLCLVSFDLRLLPSLRRSATACFRYRRCKHRSRRRPGYRRPAAPTLVAPRAPPGLGPQRGSCCVSVEQGASVSGRSRCGHWIAQAWAWRSPCSVPSGLPACGWLARCQNQRLRLARNAAWRSHSGQSGMGQDGIQSLRARKATLWR